MHGGDQIAEVLQQHGVQFLFTLCGGHISPILVGAKKCGIRVIDTRHGVTAVFAADAVARLTGVPGVAAVTAGPGVTNTLTAVKNAQLAQSPVILLGGATATALKGRGALQDIDQMALIKPHVKWAYSVKKVKDLAPALQKAFRVAQTGVPGPVFLECPVDLLYDESVVREWYGLKSPAGGSFSNHLIKMYLKHHVNRLFAGVDQHAPGGNPVLAVLHSGKPNCQSTPQNLLGATPTSARWQPGTIGGSARQQTGRSGDCARPAGLFVRYGARPARQKPSAAHAPQTPTGAEGSRPGDFGRCTM